jgi:flagellar motor switch protein FliN/FliY
MADDQTPTTPPVSDEPTDTPASDVTATTAEAAAAPAVAVDTASLATSDSATDDDAANADTATLDAAASAAPAAETSGELNISQNELDALMGVTREAPLPAASSSGDARDVMAEMAAAIASEPAAAPARTGPVVVGGHRPNVPLDAAAEFKLPDLDDASQPADLSGIDLLDDVELNVTIELGRTEMYIEDVLGLGVGAVVELNKLAGDPVDIFVNEQLIARGEVLVLNDNFCVRINDILSPVEDASEH